MERGEADFQASYTPQQQKIRRQFYEFPENIDRRSIGCSIGVGPPVTAAAKTRIPTLKAENIPDVPKIGVTVM